MRVCRSREHFRWRSRWPCQSPRQPSASIAPHCNRLVASVTPLPKNPTAFRSGVTLARDVGGRWHTSAMTDPFLGSEVLAEGLLTPYELRSRYVALHQDVYVPRDAVLTPVVRAKAGWLRSRRRGILAGFSASALHGTKWVN